MSKPSVSKQSVPVLAVLPVGPPTNPEFVKDTIDSIFYYARLPTKVLIVDSSLKGFGQTLAEEDSRIESFVRDYPAGKDGALYFRLAEAYDYALQAYEFDVLLRIDDDGLVIAPGGDVEAAAFFRSNPQVAIAGSYKITCMGKPRGFSPASDSLRRLAGIRGMIRDPGLCIAVRGLLKKALSHGYEIGEHCMGGICYINPGALRRMKEEGLLLQPALARSALADDWIFSLLAKAAGLAVADFATGDLPVGAAWSGLPCSPQDLERMGKKVTHSVRFYEDLREKDIRAYFRARRVELGGVVNPL